MNFKVKKLEVKPEEQKRGNGLLSTPFQNKLWDRVASEYPPREMKQKKSFKNRYLNFI